MKRTAVNSHVPNLNSARRISGLTHAFYRYPATTSPELVRDILLAYSEPGDLILDPFMGGGTSVVEAIAHGRLAVGIDINPLAVLVARAKTTPLTQRDWGDLVEWASGRRVFSTTTERNLDERARNFPPTLLRSFSSCLSQLSDLRSAEQRRVARCALMSVGRWALESRDNLPSSARLRKTLIERIESMQKGMIDMLDVAGRNGVSKSAVTSRRKLLCRSAEESPAELTALRMGRKVSLVITSPPYPGVHVLYHRWQVAGRRETPAAYWIANKRDGAGPSFYTMGGRSRTGQSAYFERVESVYSALRPHLAADAVIAQLVAFNDLEAQLPQFLRAMRRSGLKPLGRHGAGKLSRLVPNRRWYARGRCFDSATEYLLLHTPA